MSFEPGEKVVCIVSHALLEKGRVYTIRAILGRATTPGDPFPDAPIWTVALIEQLHGAEPDYAFDPRRFRKLKTLDTSQAMEAFRRMAQHCPAELIEE